MEGLSKLTANLLNRKPSFIRKTSVDSYLTTNPKKKDQDQSSYSFPTPPPTDRVEVTMNALESLNMTETDAFYHQDLQFAKVGKQQKEETNHSNQNSLSVKKVYLRKSSCPQFTNYKMLTPDEPLSDDVFTAHLIPLPTKEYLSNNVLGDDAHHDSGNNTLLHEHDPGIPHSRDCSLYSSQMGFVCNPLYETINTEGEKLERKENQKEQAKERKSIQKKENEEEEEEEIIVVADYDDDIEVNEMKRLMTTNTQLGLSKVTIQPMDQKLVAEEKVVVIEEASHHDEDEHISSPASVFLIHITNDSDNDEYDNDDELLIDITESSDHLDKKIVEEQALKDNNNLIIEIENEQQNPKVVYETENKEGKPIGLNEKEVNRESTSSYSVTEEKSPSISSIKVNAPSSLRSEPNSPSSSLKARIQKESTSARIMSVKDKEEENNSDLPRKQTGSFEDKMQVDMLSRSGGKMSSVNTDQSEYISVQELKENLFRELTQKGYILSNKLEKALPPTPSQNNMSIVEKLADLLRLKTSNSPYSYSRKNSNGVRNHPNPNMSSTSSGSGGDVIKEAYPPRKDSAASVLSNFWSKQEKVKEPLMEISSPLAATQFEALYQENQKKNLSTEMDEEDSSHQQGDHDFDETTEPVHSASEDPYGLQHYDFVQLYSDQDLPTLVQDKSPMINPLSPVTPIMQQSSSNSSGIIASSSFFLRQEDVVKNLLSTAANLGDEYQFQSTLMGRRPTLIPIHEAQKIHFENKEAFMQDTIVEDTEEEQKFIVDKEDQCQTQLLPEGTLMVPPRKSSFNYDSRMLNDAIRPS